MHIGLALPSPSRVPHRVIQVGAFLAVVCVYIGCVCVGKAQPPSSPAQARGPFGVDPPPRTTTQARGPFGVELPSTIAQARGPVGLEQPRAAAQAGGPFGLERQP